MADALGSFFNAQAIATTNALTERIAKLEEENVALKANVERLTEENAAVQVTVQFLTGKNARISDELEDFRKQKKAKGSSETPMKLKVDAYAANLYVQAMQVSVEKMIKTLNTETKSVKSKLASIDEMKKSGAFEAQFANQETEPSEGDV